MISVKLGLPPGILTEVLPGIRILQDCGESLNVEVIVRDYVPPPTRPAVPPTDPADVPTKNMPSHVEYDQRCLALPGEQHVDECSCTSRATTSEPA
jgi:hypothetical protein